jgi:carbamoyltransferase
MRILGVSAFGDGSGAGLVCDGQVVAAAEEARFTRRPGESGLPRRSVRFCLAQGGFSARDVDVWVFYEKPLRRFERVLAGQLSAFPRSSSTFGRELFTWLGDRMWQKTQLATEFGIDADRVRFAEHHAAHAASAFFLSPFDEAAILCVDGAGEWATTSLARGTGTKIEMLGEIHHPHSLGLASRAVARYLGFSAPGTESNVAMIAAYGEARFADEMRRFVRLESDGHYELDRRAFASDLDGGLACGPAWTESFGAARLPTDPIQLAAGDRRHADIAASFQLVLEETTLAIVRELHRRVPTRGLCLCGELAHDPSLVARIAEQGPYAELYLPPDCGDAGAALGAALFAHNVTEPARRTAPLADPCVGEAVPRESRVTGEEVALEDARIDRIVSALVDGRTVGWVRGRCEYGPRALGRRVLLADPRRAETALHVSRSITRREEFVPYSPAVIAERAEEFFEIPKSAHWPVRLRQILLRSKPAARRSAPAAIHVDGRAAAHVVDSALDPAFHRLLTRFGERTGAPMLLSTTLGPRGEPAVRSERDAQSLFERSALDLLVVEERVYARS